jgi:hypothetical protein
MKPSVGRIVLVFADPKLNNGADEAPAIITRVFSDTCVNVTVFPDATTPYPRTSVNLHATRDEAQGSRRRDARQLGQPAGLHACAAPRLLAAAGRAPARRPPRTALNSG